MMLPETLQLEKLRQEIQDLENEIGNLTAYLDPGLPDPKQSQKVEKMREEGEQAKAKLRSAIAAIRRERPEAFAEWINYHKSILERILMEKAAAGIPAQRLVTARLALSHWEQVLAGEKDYVFISSFLLDDYYAEVRSLFPQHTEQETASQNTIKSWWEFWK